MIAPSLTLRRAWEDHYRPFVEPDCADQTLRCYENAVRAWERMGSAHLPLTSLRATHFSLFKQEALKDRSPATVNRWFREMRAIFRFAQSEGLVDRVPTMRPAVVPEYVKWRPTLEQLGRLYSSVTASGVTWPSGSHEHAVDWWQSLIVWNYVGALRMSEFRTIRDVDCTADGIEWHAPKTQRLQFVAGLPCVMRQVRRMRLWMSPGQAFVTSAPGGHRQFDAARDLIGEAAGFRWWPHGLKRASVDAWHGVDPTAGTIVGHGRKSTACRHYLDRKAYLLKLMHKLPLPPEFDGTDRQMRLFG